MSYFSSSWVLGYLRLYLTGWSRGGYIPPVPDWVEHELGILFSARRKLAAVARVARRPSACIMIAGCSYSVTCHHCGMIMAGINWCRVYLAISTGTTGSPAGRTAQQPREIMAPRCHGLGSTVYHAAMHTLQHRAGRADFYFPQEINCRQTANVSVTITDTTR